MYNRFASITLLFQCTLFISFLSPCLFLPMTDRLISFTLAYQYQDDEHFKLLLDAGVDINATQKEDQNVTTYAVTNGHIEKAKTFLRQGGVIIPSDELLSTTVSISEAPLESIQLIFDSKVPCSPQCFGLGFYQCLRARQPCIDVAQLIVQGAQQYGIELANVPVNMVGSYVSVLCRFDCDKVQQVLGHQDDSRSVVLTPLEMAMIRQDDDFIRILAPSADDETKAKAMSLADRIGYNCNVAL